MAHAGFCGTAYDTELPSSSRWVDPHLDCFECAIFALAPRCAHCLVTIVGHGSRAKLASSAARTRQTRQRPWSPDRAA